MPLKHVLVVEDDDALRRLLVELLAERSEYRVEGARDGVEALHRISSAGYHVIVLDLMMPHMSGVDLLVSLEILSSDPTMWKVRFVPRVIVVTGAAEETVSTDELVGRFPHLVRRVLRKPVDPSELLGQIDRCCQEGD